MIKHFTYFGFVFALCVMVICGFSCSAPRPTPDPLSGFHVSDLQNLDSNKVITDDYKNYIHILSHEEQKFIAGIEYFEDGTGQHAIKITIGLNQRNWRHVLIYDKDNKRIKAIKYISGNSMS